MFWIKAQTLGEGGIEAGVPVSLARGEIVLLDVMIQEEILSVPARVHYQTGHLHGLQFIDITEQQRTTIRHYCQNHGVLDPDSGEDSSAI
jgi:hypothetical protein